MSTRAQLVQYIQAEARVKASSNLVPMIQGLLLEVLRDYTNKARYYELYVLDAAITTVTGQGIYPLPSGFANLDVASGIRYSPGPPSGASPFPSIFRTLYEKTDVVRRTCDVGYPLFFQLCSTGTPPSPGIFVFPYTQICAGDQLLVSYWQDPVALFNADGDNFPIPKLEPTVKKAVISRVQRFSAAFQEGQLMDTDAEGSFTAAESGK